MASHAFSVCDNRLEQIVLCWFTEFLIPAWIFYQSFKDAGNNTTWYSGLRATFMPNDLFRFLKSSCLFWNEANLSSGKILLRRLKTAVRQTACCLPLARNIWPDLYGLFMGQGNWHVSKLANTTPLHIAKHGDINSSCKPLLFLLVVSSIPA